MEYFDMVLNDLYARAGLPHEICENCDGMCPTMLLKGGVCTNCEL